MAKCFSCDAEVLSGLLLCPDCDSDATASMNADEYRQAPKLVYGQKSPPKNKSRGVMPRVYDPLTGMWVTVQQ